MLLESNTAVHTLRNLFKLKKKKKSERVQKRHRRKTEKLSPMNVNMKTVNVKTKNASGKTILLTWVVHT